MTVHTSTNERAEHRAPRKGSLRIVMIAGTLTAMATSNAAGQAYSKTFYVEGVANGARMRAGAVTQTWVTEGSTWTHRNKHRMFIGARPVSGRYKRALTNTDRDLLGGNMGFPINNNWVAGNIVNNGWHPARINSGDGHGNWSWAEVDADARLAVGPTVRIRGGATRPLENSMKVLIQGNAGTGALPDGVVPAAHSADSFAAAQIAGTKTWRQTSGGNQPRVRAYNKAAMVGGGWEQNVINTRTPRKQGKTKDPVFVTLNDLTTGESITEIVMGLDLEWRDAMYNFNDDFISLTIATDREVSYVGFEFSNESEWVTNPYNYSAWLDGDGLQVSGMLPDASAWTETVSADSITYELALDGIGTFDMAEILAPDELLTEGHDYSIDVGEGDGTFEVATIVPTPGTFALLAFAGLTASRRRR
jgi:hypothetical protein